MRRCSSCAKEYDDTWAMCLTCKIPLTAVSDSRLDRLESRVRAIEAKLGIAAPEPAARPASTTQAPAAPRPAAAAVAAPAPRRSGDIESTIGLVWLNRIGVVALLLGAALFLKYAFDHRWISEGARVAIGLFAGMGFLVASNQAARKSFDTMAQGLQGVGIGVLYLSVYAAYGFYHLIPASVAWVALAAVTAYCGLWAVRTGWMSSAVMGIIGGYWTPALLDSGRSGEPGLFVYLALLSAGVFAISMVRKWKVLVLLAFLACFYYLSQSAYLQAPLHAGMALGVLTGFFALFCGMSIARHWVFREKMESMDLGLITANALMYYALLREVSLPLFSYFPAIVPTSLSMVYIGFAYSAYSRRRDDRDLTVCYTAISTLFVTLAIPAQMKYQWVGISWSLEALILLWIGFRLSHERIRLVGLAVGAVALFRLFFIDYPYWSPFERLTGQGAFFNERLAAFAVYAAVTALASALYQRHEGQIRPGEKGMAKMLAICSHLLVVYELTVEIHRFFDLHAARSAAREFAVSGFWTLYALGAVAAGMRFRFRGLRLLGLSLFGLAVFKVFIVDLSQVEAVYRILSFVALGGLLMAASFFYQRHKNEIRQFVKE